MKGFAFVPGNKLNGAFTVPNVKKYGWVEPPKTYEGGSLYLAGMGGGALKLAGGNAPTIQSIIANEMSKSGRGITVEPPPVIGNAPDAGHSSGGALRLAGQRHSRSPGGCGYDETLPGQLLKAKLDKLVKRRKKGGSLNLPIQKGDKMESGEYDSGKSSNHYKKMRGSGVVVDQIKKHIANVVLPEMHKAVNLPVLKAETYKKIVNSVGLKSAETANDLKDFAVKVAKTHMPILMKMANKKMGGNGFKDSAKSKLLKVFLKPIMAGVLDGMKSSVMTGSGVSPRVKNFIKQFSKGFFSVIEPSARVLLPLAATALGQPELVPVAGLANAGISALKKGIERW